MASRMFEMNLRMRIETKFKIKYKLYQHDSAGPLNAPIIVGWPNCNSDHIVPAKFIKLTFAASGCYSSLWPKATTFKRSHRGYLRPLAATVRCGQRPQHLISYSVSETDHIRLAQLYLFVFIIMATFIELAASKFIVARGQSIHKVIKM